ncbi:hypothetical protein HDU88_002705 [Geranomyces variabilis]|nr:hypothetical protein HDU88_002705 [Geranomyces variabilis]
MPAQILRVPMPPPPSERDLQAQSLGSPSTPGKASQSFFASIKPSAEPQQRHRWTLPTAFRQQYGTAQDNLGSGGSGFIFSAVRRSDQKEVAVKLLPVKCVPVSSWVNDPDYGCIPREVATLKNIRHSAVVAFIDLFQDEHILLIVMELFGSSWRTSPLKNTDPNPLPLATRPARSRAMDLFELLEVKQLTEEEARTIFIQLIECVHYLLSQLSLVHGDIKDENILIDWSGPKPVAKFIDFGGAVIVAPGNLCTQGSFRGTIEFASPEIIKGQSYDPEKSESWSLGVLLYSMINRGCGPFATRQATVGSPYRPLICSPRCSHLISRLLDKNPTTRATIQEVLQHPWLTKSSRKAL